MTKDLQRRLLFIVHRGLVEMRLLAQAGKTEQIRDLADALEVLPGWVNDDRDAPSAADIKADLEQYEQRYPGAFKYADFIDVFDPPTF